MTFREAVNKYRVKLTATLIEARPDGLREDMPVGSTHWRLKITRPAEMVQLRSLGDGTRRATFRPCRRSWTVYWSQGPACAEPRDAAEVLEGLKSDRVLADFDNWARGWEYDTDSRKAERIYKACVKATKQWARFWEGTPLASEDWYPTEAV